MANPSAHRDTPGQLDSPRRSAGWSDTDLRTLFSRLNNDATQLVHDELELAKLELRDIAETLSADLKQAGSTLAKDMGKVLMSASLALLAGLAFLTAAILGIGRLLGGAYWAGALITGVLLAIGVALFGMSAARDVKESDELRLEHTRRTVARDKRVLQDEAQRTKEFVRTEARAFKQNVTRDVEH